ncbi:uncharacterized protein LOC106070898 isoform X3 [Biomphalaria glabrata]|uniref:Uncharacterized protein LOC106070898 isoform X3 n=1 Tax=Biomphalaria glabrata TaxID=6526 RepID=A0A9W2Z3M1_BIOGL|nr:uncharacterized protein LOC106070898 isoform X3 [Biomphalaria glabrata]
MTSRRCCGYSCPGLTSPGGLYLSAVLVLVLICACESIVFLGERETYAKYPKWNACSNASIQFEFKTTQKDGLLMFTDDRGQYDYLQVAIVDGSVHLWINFVREINQNLTIALGKDLNDGRWHNVAVKRNRMESTLEVDNNQFSRVSFGSDFNFGDFLETNNYMYFGGLPLLYNRSVSNAVLPVSVQNTPFVGEIRNILYFNCSCMPVRPSVIEDRGTSRRPQEACEIRNPCDKNKDKYCVCISADDGPGCQCIYKQNCLKDLLADYVLPMDSIRGDIIQNPSGLDAKVYGGADLVRGVHEMALKIDGVSQWLRVTGAAHKGECFGDLSHCSNGYYVGLWVQFVSQPTRKAVYMSNGGHSPDGHGIAMYYYDNGLEFVFKTKDGKEWRAEARDIFPGRWYHVAASWASDKGLFVYVNGEQAASSQQSRRVSASQNGGQFKDFVIGRSNERTGHDQQVPMIVDDFIFKSSFETPENVKEEGPAFLYYLPMEKITRDRLEMTGGSAKIVGQVQTVPGLIGNALSFTSRGEYVDLGDASKKCLGDLDICKHGFYISFFIKFQRIDGARSYIFSSPHGMDIYRSGSLFVASAQKGSSIWEAQYRDLISDVWYFVEVSWSMDGGIVLYVNGEEVDRQVLERPIREPRVTSEMKVFLGRSNQGSRTDQLAHAELDEMNIFYGTRDMLGSLGYIPTDRPENYHIDFENIQGNRVLHDRLSINLYGSPRQANGKVGRALKLNGVNDYADIYVDSDGCFADLTLCQHGVLYSMWIHPDRLRDNTYFLSSGNRGITLLYRGGSLNAVAETATQRWEASTPSLEVNKWNFVEVSYHPVRGLKLFVNNELKAQDASPERFSSQSSSDRSRFFLGRGKTSESGSTLAEATFDEMELWQADRDYLASRGYIQRTRPKNYLITFEELIGEDRLKHPTLNINLMQRPMLIPGKVNNALELSGRGQYADLGRHNDECMSNLYLCNQGITIAAWMRFHRFENNMVFLSTGENGILMMYKDGYIQFSVAGDNIITVPRFDTERWYFVEITWHPKTGLKVYVDNQLREKSDKTFTPRSSARGNFYIGYPNSGDIYTSRYANGILDIDELEIWYSGREDLLAFGYINRDNLGYESFSFDMSEGSRVIHNKYLVTLYNDAKLASGRMGSAVSLLGQRQYVDLGEHYQRCFGNIDLCSHGFTMSVWLNPRDLREGTTFISAPTYNIGYQNGRLRAEFQDKTKRWTTSSNRLRSDEWQRLTMAWHPKKGLSMYLNDELADEDTRGIDAPQRDQPLSEHVYIGRPLSSDRLTTNMMADELQVWYDDLTQLRATGQYKVQAVPINIVFDDFRNNYYRLKDREIRAFGDYRIEQGRSTGSKAIYLYGTTSYLDLGNNFTCGGDLNSCYQGATIRLGIRPDQLKENTYFLDSFPVKIYYQNDRLYGQLQTPTQIWTVNSREIEPGKWQRVELTWHPKEGLMMYINGRKVDSQRYGSDQQVQPPTDWKTYFGRSLEGRSPHVQGSVDSIEFWTAYRDYLPEDGYLRLPPYQPPRPPPTTYRPDSSDKTFDIIGDISTEQRTPRPSQQRRVKIIDFNGAAMVKFNFHELPPDYLKRMQKEDFQFYFYSRGRADGLLWLHEDTERKMYIALKDGYLIFVIDDYTGQPRVINIGQRDGVRFDDSRWYLFKMHRDGRTITMTVDDKYPETFMFSRNMQLLSPGYVYLAGTENTYRSTNGNIVRNFNGGMAQVLYQGERMEGSQPYIQEVNLITQFGDNFGEGIKIVNQTWYETVTSSPDPVVTRAPRPRPTWPDPGPEITVPTVATRTPRPTLRPTTPPLPPLTQVTIKDKTTYFIIQESFIPSSGNSLSFKFQTIKNKALLLYAMSNIAGKNFFEFEIYDGLLYFVYNFGGTTKRKLISNSEVSDGQSHELSIRFQPNQIIINLDGSSVRIPLEQNEQLPTTPTKVHVGGYISYDLLPWHTWARSNYQGCLEDFKMNSQTVDFKSLVQNLPAKQVESICVAMPQECSSRPCTNGYCLNQWGGYYCDCRATEFAGLQCGEYALTGVYNGSTYNIVRFQPSRQYHVNDISFRFKTLSPDGLIFQTRDRSDKSFIRAELVGGRVRITMFFDGKTNSFFVGDENLNDLQWHTIFVQRRGNHLEFWVDDKPHRKEILPAVDFKLNIDELYVGGGTGDSSFKNYIGYLQNFFIENIDVFHDLNVNYGPLPRSNQLPPLIFNGVTFPHYQSFLQLPTLSFSPKLNIHFLFKTNDPNGVILFSEGRNNELFAVELFDGKIHVKIDIPGKPPLRISTPENRRFNDGNWHSVSIVGQTVNGQKQLFMTADELQSSNSYSLIDQIVLQGPLYIGGISESVSQKANVKTFLSSKTGYRGCLASVYLGTGLPNLLEVAQGQKVNVLNSCQDIVSQCTKTTCKNGGVCHDHLNNGTTWCDCSRTGYGGPLCEDEPLGYYFRNERKIDLYGMLIHRTALKSEHEQDEIVFGLMTDEKNAVLVKLISNIFDDFVEIKLVDGYVVATYDTDGKGGAQTTITNTDVMVSDKQYHIIKLLRTKDKGVLTVDTVSTTNTHASAHGNFNALEKIFIGGVYQGKKILDGYHGIIAGLFVNDKLIFNEKLEFQNDVVQATHPFIIGKIEQHSTQGWITSSPTPVITTPPPALIPVIPPNIGGGGIAGFGPDVVVFPDLSGGSADDLTNLGPIGDPVAAAQISVIPSLPAVGPRAGAVMGTILGLAALASSLMWAFYRCKPGWCAGLKPAETPLSISPPRSNIPLLKQQAAVGSATGAGGAMSGSGAGAGGDADVVDAVTIGAARAVGISGGVAGGTMQSNSSYYQQSSTNVHQRSDSYDSATLRATGTFTNKGTAIGTPRMGRHQMGSTSASYTESNVAITPASLQSYHFEGGNSTADYDVASGVHSGYQGNTLTSGGGGGYSTSTMSSNYNYTVKTIRNVGGQQAAMGYAAGSLSNVIVTPGAMGEEIRVDCCLMTGDGHSVVTGSSLGPPQVWNMSTGELLRIMHGETVGSTNLHLVCNDKLLVGAINTDLEINQYSTPKGVHNYQFQIWDFASGRPLEMAQQETCSALTVMSDNDKVVFGRSDKFGGGTNIVVWDLMGNQAIKEMRYDAPVGNNDYISYISLSQNDRYVVAGFNNTFDNYAEFVIFDMTLTSYNISDPNILRLNATPECTAILPHDEAVTGLRNGDLVVWSLRTGQPIRQLFSNNGKHAHTREVKAVARSQDNKYLVSASADGTLKVFDLETERHMNTLSGHNDEVWCACISSDNEIVVSGSRDGTIRLWRLKSGQEICAFNAGVDVFYITMSQDKGTIVALGDKFGARKLIMLQVVRSKVKRQVLA